MSAKYRLKAYNVKNDIYYIQKRICFIWWPVGDYGAGKKEKMEEILRELHGLQEESLKS